MILQLILLALFVYFIFKFATSKSGKNEPPEPFGLPFVGHIPFVGTEPPATVMKWCAQLGKIFKVRLVIFDEVFLNDHKMIRETFNEQVASGRPKLKFFEQIVGGRYGILFNDGPSWAEQRRFTLRHMRDFGFGTRTMENLINEEVKDMLEGFRKEAGNPISVQRRFNIAVMNSLWVIITGHRYSHDDPELTDRMERMEESFNLVTQGVLAILFPWVAKHIFPKLSGWGAFEQIMSECNDYFQRLIDEHKRTLDPEGQPRDFIDAYLQEIQKTTDPSSSFHKSVGEKNLIAVISDLFMGGSSTTSLTLNWATLFLSQNMAAQEKLQSEIEKVVGSGRLPSLNDRVNMPYTEALIHEILRKSSILPFSPGHSALSDMKIGGYDIPKGSVLVGAFRSVHHSKEAYGDPDNFRPERFLNEDGHFIRKTEAFFPFSAGKRACPGETLARDELFLFLTCLLQRFKIVPDPSEKNVRTDPKWSAISTPHPYKVIMTERF